MCLQSWSMVDWVNDTVAERQATLDPSQTAGQVSEIEEDMLRRVEKVCWDGGWILWFGNW